MMKIRQISHLRVKYRSVKTHLTTTPIRLHCRHVITLSFWSHLVDWSRSYNCPPGLPVPAGCSTHFIECSILLGIKISLSEKVHLQAICKLSPFTTNVRTSSKATLTTIPHHPIRTSYRDQSRGIPLQQTNSSSYPKTLSTSPTITT